MTRPLWAYSIGEAADAIRDGRCAPVDFVDACIERSRQLDPLIHSYLHLDADAARRDALSAGKELAAGRDRGVLHGLPFAVKANYDVTGMPSCAGSRLRLARRPESDARLVAQLREQGAICTGLLSTWEYGTGNGGEYFDLPFPPARNPWDPERFTGGSSTGAGASVAAGTIAFALGSDTTGSVRLPAAACGLAGMIMTPGRLSPEGILPNCYSLDIPGPLTWTVEDLAMVLDVLAKPTTSYSRTITRPMTGRRIGVMRGPLGRFQAPDASMAQAFEGGIAVLERLGARLVDVVLPIPVPDCFDVTRIIGPAESAAIHEPELRERPGDMGFALRDKLLAGSLVRAVDYIQAQRQRRLIADAVECVMRNFDAIVTYGPLHVAPRLGVEPEMTAFTVETCLTPFNLSAHPAMVQCTGFSSGGLPLSWQIVANRHDEAKALAIGAAYERATPWRERRPKL